MATWEFAAGRYPHPGASLLLPLVTLGLMWSPRAIWRAFMMGRRTRSFYRPEMIALDLPALRDRIRPGAAESPRARLSDGFAFAGLILQSASIFIAPVLAAALFAIL